MRVEFFECSAVYYVSPVRVALGQYDGERWIGKGDICASYSADLISDKRPIRQFEYNGALWVCTSAVHWGEGSGKKNEHGEKNDESTFHEKDPKNH